jgi:signal transduction histidine kinase
MAPHDGRTRTRRFTRKVVIGVVAAAVVATVAVLATWFSGEVIHVAVISSSAALLLGALAARTMTRSIEHRLRDTVTNLMTVEDQLAYANRELEQRVDQRTAELSEANRRLETEMTRRSQIEVELRQAQKLESVGQLASGIAHEINTPVQFVSDSCSFLESATADLIAVIDAYRASLAELDRSAGGPAVADAVERMRETEADRDVAYLVEQIPLAISRALQGLGRVSAIVSAMKEFAYRDRREQAPADLNRAILSTLTVARNEYKYVAEVKTELEDLW